jgi:hypothetical protein
MNRRGFFGSLGAIVAGTVGGESAFMRTKQVGEYVIREVGPSRLLAWGPYELRQVFYANLVCRQPGYNFRVVL